MKFEGKDAVDFSEGVIDERGKIKARILSEVKDINDRRNQAAKCQNILLEVCQKIRNHLHIKENLELDATISSADYEELVKNMAVSTIEDIIKSIKSGALETPDLQIK
jgi:hypothetical protein